MSHLYKNRKKLTATVIGCTFVFCCIWYIMYKPNGFQINIGEEHAVYVREVSKFEQDYKSLQADLTKRFGYVQFKDNITIGKIKIHSKMLSDDATIKQSLLDNNIQEVNAVEMRSSGKVIALVANEAEGKLVLDYIKKYYISKSGIKNIKECSVKENITYSKVKVMISKVKLIEEAAINIINANHVSKTPYIVVIIKGNTDSSEKISFSTIIKWDSKLELGKNNILSQGKDGVKLIQKVLTFENKRLIGENIISEKIIQKEQDRVIIKGSMAEKTTSIVAFATPSRGIVTSGFGERWGKMHCGMDIGAVSGSPILAALDGVVSYSGWEQGYGNTITINHANNIMTLYGHCSKINVVLGQSVKKGDVIGAVGSTGNSTGPHLHFEVRVNGVAVNPTSYLK